MSKRYYGLECDNPKCGLYKMIVEVTNNTASCHCLCGYHNTVDLSKVRSMAASREKGSAFFISGEGKT